MNRGILLYGPPAVGKDTVTRELEKLGPFVQFKRIKSGPGRTTGYRMVDEAHIQQLRPPEALYVNRRYGATYVVDRKGLDLLWETGSVPVVHIGQPEAVTLIKTRTPDVAWLVVDLHCPIRELSARINARNTGDHDERVRAAQATPRLEAPNLAVGTRDIAPAAVAQLISQTLESIRV